MRFDDDSPLPTIVKTIPPNSPSEGVRVAFIVHDGAPIEFLCITPSAAPPTDPRS